jgi:hypothetical protein
MKALLPLIFFASITIAFAADPFHGSWKQSNELSGGQIHIEHESPPILKIDVTGDKAIVYQWLGGSESTSEYALDGTPTRRKSGSGAGDDWSLKRVHPNVWHFYQDKHRKFNPQSSKPITLTREGHWSVSSDGKVLTQGVLRTYSDGETKYYFRVFEKQ